MHRLTRDDIEQAARHVYQVMPATAQYAWPLLAERLGCTVWVKHENHTPTGAFKVRGGVPSCTGSSVRTLTCGDCPARPAATMARARRWRPARRVAGVDCRAAR